MRMLTRTTHTTLGPQRRLWKIIKKFEDQHSQTILVDNIKKSSWCLSANKVIIPFGIILIVFSLFCKSSLSINHPRLIYAHCTNITRSLSRIYLNSFLSSITSQIHSQVLSGNQFLNITYMFYSILWVSTWAHLSTESLLIPPHVPLYSCLGWGYGFKPLTSRGGHPLTKGK